jgi:hypothetical protein
MLAFYAAMRSNNGSPISSSGFVDLGLGLNSVISAAGAGL